MYLPTVTRFWQPPIYVDQCWSFISLIFFNYDKCQFRWLHRGLWKLESNIVAIDGYQSKATPQPPPVQKNSNLRVESNVERRFEPQPIQPACELRSSFSVMVPPKNWNPTSAKYSAAWSPKLPWQSFKHMETTHILHFWEKQEIWMTYGESV